MDKNSLRALRMYRLAIKLFFISIIANVQSPRLETMVPPSMSDWIWPGTLFFVILSGVVIVLLSKRVRCPHCSHVAVLRLVPSWHKPLPESPPGTIRCAHCHEVIDIKAGMTPPAEAQHLAS